MINVHQHRKETKKTTNKNKKNKYIQRIYVLKNTPENGKVDKYTLKLFEHKKITKFKMGKNNKKLTNK